MQNQQLGRRLVQLRGMQRHAERRADVGGGERIGERDAPGQRRRLAVAAAREQAAEPPDDVAERDARREHVAVVHSGSPTLRMYQQRDDHREDQSAVEHAAGAGERQQLARIGA